MRGAVCGSRGVRAISDYHAGGYADADADRNAADRDGYSCASDPDDNADAHEDVGSANGRTHAHEGAHADAYPDRDVVDGDSDVYRYSGGYRKHADASAYHDTHPDEDARSDRNPDRDVGHAEVNADDGAEQDAYHGRHVHAKAHACGDQDSDESADAQGDDHPGSDAH